MCSSDLSSSRMLIPPNKNNNTKKGNMFNENSIKRQFLEESLSKSKIEEIIDNSKLKVGQLISKQNTLDTSKLENTNNEKIWNNSNIQQSNQKNELENNIQCEIFSWEKRMSEFQATNYFEKEEDFDKINKTFTMDVNMSFGPLNDENFSNFNNYPDKNLVHDNEQLQIESSEVEDHKEEEEIIKINNSCTQSHSYFKDFTSKNQVGKEFPSNKKIRINNSSFIFPKFEMDKSKDFNISKFISKFNAEYSTISSNLSKFISQISKDINKLFYNNSKGIPHKITRKSNKNSGRKIQKNANNQHLGASLTFQNHRRYN